MPKHVAVLMGGWSAEREVSLVSGQGVAKVLQERGYRVTPIDVKRDLSSLLKALTPKPDVIFNALHGRGGEDGTIQGVLEILQIPYTHSGVLASAIAMDKPLTKRLLSTVGVPMAKSVLATKSQIQAGHVLLPPYVIKPTNEGSSVGILIIKEKDPFPVLDRAWSSNHQVMVEQYIPGKDLTVAVLGTKGQTPKALTVTEIRPASGFYDYTAKYTDGKATHVIPAKAPQIVLDEAMRIAVLAHTILGCTGATRSDFRWDDSKPGPAGLVFLEINTQPGMTPLSLVPEQAQHLGQSYADLVIWMVENAACHS